MQTNAHKAQGQGEGSYSNTICHWISCQLFLIYLQKMEILSQIVCCVKSSILNFWNSSVSGRKKMDLTKTGQSLLGLTSSINCQYNIARQYSSKHFGLRYQ